MSEWESICSAHAKEACAPADARELNPEILHLYLQSGILDDKNYRFLNATWGRVFPQQGQVTIVNAVPDPSWAGKSRPAAIGGVAVIRRPNNRSLRPSWFYQQDVSLPIGNVDTVVLPAGSVEFRLGTTPERTAGVFARIEMVARGITVDVTQGFHDLHRMSFIKIRSGIMSFYDLILTYGMIGTAGTQELLTYYHPASIGSSGRFPSDDAYEVPIELAVFQPTQADDPVAVVRDPATREGFCRVFSCPSFCDTPDDPFVRAFGQIILDGTVGDQETYEAYYGDSTPIDNCYGAARVYMRSVAYNVGKSERNPTGPHWITRPPMMQKPANNASFSYDYSGDGRTESYPAAWSRDFVGDHQRTRLTQGLAGITATPTTAKIPSIFGDADSVTFSFAGTPPTSASIDLPYQNWSPVRGRTFTLHASNTTQNVFFGQGESEIIHEDDPPQGGIVTQNFPQFIASFTTEELALAHIDTLNANQDAAIATVQALNSQSTIQEVDALLTGQTSYQYRLVFEQWLGEASVYSAGDTVTATTSISDDLPLSDSDFFRFHSPALDVRKNAFSAGTEGQLSYQAQIDHLVIAGHFSHQVVRYVKSAKLIFPAYEAAAHPSGNWYVLKIGEQHTVVSFPDDDLPVSRRFTTHRSARIAGQSSLFDARNVTVAIDGRNELLESVEFLP